MWQRIRFNRNSKQIKGGGAAPAVDHAKISGNEDVVDDGTRRGALTCTTTSTPRVVDDTTTAATSSSCATGQNDAQKKDESDICKKIHAANHESSSMSAVELLF